MKNFILASQSPRRQEILKDAGVAHTVIPSDANEDISLSLPPEKYVMELALLKGAAVASGAKKNDIIISADTVVVSDGEIMGKPKDFEDAKAMLMKLSGKWHSVLTGYCVINGENGSASVKYEETKVKFRNLSENEAVRYIRSGESMDKAGGYGIQGKGRLLVEKIDGDYFNVVGLPICALAKMLKEDFGIDIL
ncbi:MAG: septum formation inhibitor Maf [Clostridia bacterium]|nr:septum formation inhibitor Maf [Clostridia bacterium]